jgi:hypothetical protein
MAATLSASSSRACIMATVASRSCCGNAPRALPTPLVRRALAPKKHLRQQAIAAATGQSLAVAVARCPCMIVRPHFGRWIEQRARHGFVSGGERGQGLKVRSGLARLPLVHCACSDAHCLRNFLERQLSVQPP